MCFAVTIGKDAAGRAIKLGDIARRGGTYVLGKPRTGKSKLMISMAAQDIAHGHGVLFIDPHADAINELVGWIPRRRFDDILLLDPTDSTYAFGINPLYCANPRDLREQQLSFGQARDVFAKAFEKDEALGILLRKYLSNCLYPLIDTQGFCLYDLWDFLLKRAFRDAVLAKVRHHREVVDFWQLEFDQMPPRAQREETESLLTRLDILRTNPYIKHILAQPVPTIDFAKVLTERKIVLLRIPAWQDEESRSFVSTLVLSQLLKVIFLRAEISQHLRTPFALYIDELEYCSTPDVAKLFTQTGKWNLMPLVAHQTRDGQLQRDDPNRGATLAAPNKVFFSLATPDSAECAPEVAKDSPTETKRERILIISQHPFEDILRGHANPEVQAFVTEYLRSLAHRLEDTKATLEAERIKRLFYLDTAAIHRIWAQFGKDNPYINTYSHDSILAQLKAAAGAMHLARNQTLTMLEVHESIQSLIKVLRLLDSFLTAVMEGRLERGQDAFVRSLLEIVAVFFPVSPALTTYTQLAFGDPTTKHDVAFAVAKRFGLFPQTVSAVERQVAAQDQQERDAYLQQQWANYHRKVTLIAEKVAWQKPLQTRFTLNELADWSLSPPYYWGGPGYSVMLIDILELYLVLCEYPRVRELLSPYLTARFAPPWADKLPKMPDLLARTVADLQGQREGNARLREEAREYQRRRKWTWLTGQEAPPPRHYQEERVHDAVLENLQCFLEQHAEGALVVFALLLTVAEPRRWRFKFNLVHSWYPDFSDADWRKYFFNWQGPRGKGYERYDGYNMLYVPALVDKEPLDVALTLDKLAAATSLIHFWPGCAQYFWRGDGKPPTQGYRKLSHHPPFCVDSLGREARVSEELGMREDVQHLKSLLMDGQSAMRPLDRLAKRVCGGSTGHHTLISNYLLARACDLVRFGQDVADLTFPLSSLPGASAKEVAAAVAPLTGILEAERARNIEEENAPWLVTYEGQVTENFNHWLRRRLTAGTYPKPPVYLPPRALSQNDMAAVIKACRAELSASSVVTVVDDFVRFIDLLARPENHVRVPSTQYCETQVNTYTTQEMTNQMAKELRDLPARSAYAKLVSLAPDSQSVWKGKIQTLELADTNGRGEAVERYARDNCLSQGILRKRSAIEAEIRQRQERWRPATQPLPAPPPTRTGGARPPAPPKSPSGNGAVPPPTSTSPRGAEAV